MSDSIALASSRVGKQKGEQREGIQGTYGQVVMAIKHAK
jgi:hypothetical protein